MRSKPIVGPEDALRLLHVAFGSQDFRSVLDTYRHRVEPLHLADPLVGVVDECCADYGRIQAARDTVADVLEAWSHGLRASTRVSSPPPPQPETAPETGIRLVSFVDAMAAVRARSEAIARREAWPNGMYCRRSSRHPDIVMFTDDYGETWTPYSSGEEDSAAYDWRILLVSKTPPPAPAPEGIAARASEIGKMLEAKNAAYGDAYARSAEYLRLLFPHGIEPPQYPKVLFIVRILDKLSRIASAPDGAGGEDPFLDIAGYALLELSQREPAQVGAQPKGV